MTSEDLNLDAFIYVPSIDLYIAKEKTLLGLNWDEAHQRLINQGLQMLTIPYLIEFINYLKKDYQDRQEAETILDEILSVRLPFRGELLDAFFKQEEGEDDLYILTHNKTHVEKLDSCLIEDKALGITLGHWLGSPTKQGLPRNRIEVKKKGGFYYYAPMNGRITRFGAGSVWVFLDCHEFPLASNPSFGVRAVYAGD